MKKPTFKMPRIRLLLVFTGILVFISGIFLSYGYAALNTELSISGEGYVRVAADIRITNLKVLEKSSGAYETYNNKYSKNTTSIFANLPNQNSYIIYEVEVTNNSSRDYIFTELISESYTNKNVVYESIDTEILDVIEKNSTKKIKLKVSNKSGYTNQSATIVLKYTFEIDKAVAPVITGANSGWVSKASTISIKTAGTATSGVKHYEYYTTTSTTKPGISTSATGVTTNNITINTAGVTYVYYRTVSNMGTKSDWSSSQVVRIDVTPPEITVTTGTDSNIITLTFAATDNVQVSSIKQAGTVVSTGSSNKLNYVLSTTNDLNGVKITATDSAGNSTIKTVNLKFLFSDANNHRTANTGGWSTNYFYSLYGNVSDIYYDTTNNRMIVSGSPTTTGQGRLGTYYTNNKISLSLYDRLMTIFWVNKASTGKIEMRLDGSVLAQDDFTTKPFSKRGLTEINGGYWVGLSSNIENYNSSYNVVLGINGDPDKYVETYVAISYLYSFR